MLSTVTEILKRSVVARRHRHNEAAARAAGHADGVDPTQWGATVSPQGSLQIGGCDVWAMAQRYGTPLILVDRSRLEADYRAFHGAFHAHVPDVEIGYSYKTNPLPGVIEILHGLGAMAEVISHFELWLALELGVPPSRIIFNGPAKEREAIALAVARGVRMINLDSLEEMDLVAAAARGAGKRQCVGVRVTTSVGWSSQFGMSLGTGEALAAFKRLKEFADLEPAGLHMHLGTGIRQVEPYRRASHELMSFSRSLQRELGIDISVVDVGGGFAVPTVRAFDIWDERLMRHGWPAAPIAPDQAPRPEDYARAITSAMLECYPDDAGRPTLVLEPGRAMTSSAQSLLLRVLALKRAGSDRPVAILDGGKNIAVPLGYEQHELLSAGNAHAPRECRYDFYGPLCHPGDRLFAAKSFSETAPGDVVAVMDAGAYFVPNQRNFSYPRPAAVLAHEGRHRVLRARESFDDIVRHDRFGRSSTAVRSPARVAQLQQQG